LHPLPPKVEASIAKRREARHRVGVPDGWGWSLWTEAGLRLAEGDRSVYKES